VVGCAGGRSHGLAAGRDTALFRIEKDPRIGSTQMQKSRWFTFELSSDADLHDALNWLNRAYDAAGKSNKSR
jgi:hypothetical protein